MPLSATCATLSSRRQMVLIRVLEERLQTMCDAGECSADLHLNTGQEAIAVGVCAALQPQDLVLTHHRMIGWALCKGVPLDVLVKELLHGAAGEMHFRAPEYGFLHSFQIVGTVVPVAAGVAWAVKHVQKTGGIVVAVCGDAATANGQFHEGLNIAAVNDLPLLVVCENNGVAGNVRSEHYQPVKNVRERMVGYNSFGWSVNGNDVVDVHQATRRARVLIRQSPGPMMIECRTQRLGKHKQGMGDLRSPEEMAGLRQQDPLRNITDEERAEAMRMVDAALQ